METAAKVIVFGVFDGIHDGHRHFLHEATKHGDELLIAVTQDQVVEDLKGRRPDQDLSTRMQALSAEFPGARVLAGDKVIGHWNIIRREQPDIVALGYDQTAMHQALLEQLATLPNSVRLVSITAHKPDELHTSLLRRSQTS